MWYACKNKSTPLEVLELMIEAGTDLRKSDERGETSLMFAANQGCHGLNIIKVLVEAGSDVNHKDLWGKSILSKC